MTAAYIALGSNLGDSRALLRSALADLADLPDTRLESISPAYCSEAIGPVEQPDYINHAATSVSSAPRSGCPTPESRSVPSCWCRSAIWIRL